MTSTSPYKSKLFNFLNRRSIQFNTNLAKAARRFKITLEWGAQISVYPLYLLVQSSRVATRQFAAAKVKQQQTKQQDQPQAIAKLPPLETPEDLLASASAIIAVNTDLAETESLELQGIACELRSQKIMFVDQTNQPVQPEQSQAVLQAQITALLNAYYEQKYRQRQTSLTSQDPRILPPIKPNNPTLFKPVRWLLEGISWLEQSPVAIALNFFGESNWRTAVVPPEVYNPKLLPPLPLQPLLTPFDTRLAQLEENLLEPDPEPELPLLKRFFQRALKRLLDHEHATAITKVNESPQPKTPWLTWNDLFAGTYKDSSSSTPPIAPAKGKAMAIAPIPKLRNDLTPFVQPTTDITANEAPELNPVPMATEIATEPSNQATLAVNQAQRTQKITTSDSNAPQTDIEAQPEWIETNALNMGYEEHFLEKILKTVDQIMAWLEDTVSKIFSKFRA